MDRELIKTLIDSLAGSDLAELEFSTPGGDTLRLVKRATMAAMQGRVAAGSQGEAVSTSTAAKASRNGSTAEPSAKPVVSNEVRAPLYGVLHLQPSPSEPPFVTAGQPVEAGQPLCVIEAMKVFNQVLAERSGVIDAVLVASGSEVDAGQPLFSFR